MVSIFLIYVAVVKPCIFNICDTFSESEDAPCAGDESALLETPARKGRDVPREIKPSHPAAERHPLTKDQKRQLEEDLTNVEDKLDDIVVLLRAAYGEESQCAIRAEEVWGALQRLRWQLER
jgi:hypothetical protein